MEYNIQTKVFYGGSNHRPIPNVGFGEFVMNRIQHTGKKPALIEANTEDVLTFEEIYRQSTAYVNIFHDLGLRKGDSVLIYANNRLEFVIPMIAALYNGILVAPINFEYIKDELVHCVSITKPRVIFCTTENVHRILEALPKCKFIKDIIIYDYHKDTKASTSITAPPGVKIYSYTQLLDKFKHRDLPPAEPVDSKNDVAFVFSSSGTTGLPKGVMLTHHNVMTSYILFIDGMLSNPELRQVVIIFLPLFHAYGNQVTLYGIIENTQSIIMPKFNEERFYQLIEKYRVKMTFVVPPICILISKSKLAKKYDLSVLDTFFSGAAPLSKEVETELQKQIKIPRIRQGYGLTESTLGVIATPVEKIQNKWGTVGAVLPGQWVKIIDLKTGDAVGPNKKGEICLKGPMIMKGYYANPQATKDTIDKDGWLHTGDIGYYDEDYYFYVVDRLKELIKYKGFQIAPAELEALILTHPSVQDVGVVGIPDDMSGEKPCAFVVRKNNENISEKEIISYVAARVSPQKHLSRVVFTNEIPKNPSGKILRRKLRELVKNLKPSL